MNDRGSGPVTTAENGYELLARELSESGIGTAFGVMGEANLDLVACLVQRHGLRYVPARTEAGAVSMAEGYAHASSQIGVATVTCGPGLTNAISALTSAVRAQTPLLLITGQLPLAMTSRSQTIDQHAILVPTGAIIEHVADAADLPGAVRRTIAAMRERRLPAVINVLMPVLAAEITVGRRPATPSIAPTARQPDEVSPRDLAAFADRLAQAKRPVILAGRGAVQADAGTALAGLAERIDAALLTSLLANGLFAQSPRNLGIAGGLASGQALDALAQADVVAVFGASLNGWTTRGGQFAPQAQILHCDRHPQAFAGATIPVTATITGDAKVVASQLERLASARWSAGSAPASTWWRRNGPVAEPVAETKAGLVDPRLLCSALNAILPEQRSLVIDAGHFLEFPCRSIAVPDVQAFNFTVHFGCVGLGLATAIGAAVGRPERRAVAVLGDGGLMMSLNEIETAARLAIPVVFLVMNDGAYGAEIKHLEDGGWPVALATFSNPDFAAVARALGAGAASVRSLDDLVRLGPALQHLEGPFLIDAKVDPTVKAEWMAIMKTARRQ